MDEFETGKAEFLEMVKKVDPQVQVVIPTTSANSMFLISLAKGKAKKFITISEDDLVDLTEDDLIRSGVEDQIRQAISEISVPP
jgi:hypothetical protein